MLFPNIMVDLETTHTLPDRGAILQIAAVRFNLEDRTVDAEHMFDRCLDIPPSRHWSEATRHWWSQQKHETLKQIRLRAEPHALVMLDFIRWAADTPTGGEPLRFWSKPAHFDFNFISSYCHDLKIPNPFHFRVATDMRSYVRGLYAPDEPPNIVVPFEGEVHDAIFDTLHQIETLFAFADDSAKARDRHSASGLGY